MLVKIYRYNQERGRCEGWVREEGTLHRQGKEPIAAEKYSQPRWPLGHSMELKSSKTVSTTFTVVGFNGWQGRECASYWEAVSGVFLVVTDGP